MLLLGALWIAGGASRADVPGQFVVRGVAWSTLVVGILFGRREWSNDARVPAVFLLAALALTLVQLVPLPPAVWQSLPGRNLLTEQATGDASVWRPLSMVPGATINAACSLVVPFTVLLFAARLRPAERLWLPGILLGLVAASTLVALVQFSGIIIDNPFINDTPGERAGTFANRNHFAVFAAFGCMLAPVWAFAGGRRPGWRAPFALGLVLVFALMILASGSRAGMVVGILALAGAFLLSGHDAKRALKRYPRWVFPALVAAIVAVIGIAVLLSIAADRAVSVDRVFSHDPGQDMRVRGLPVVLAMIREYFPIGSGLGGFDPVFRIHEPFALLKLTYFNHAHDEFLEVVLDAGLPGAVLLLSALGWWVWASVRAWRGEAGRDRIVPRLGSAMLLLVIVASIVDYPARTPMMMAMVVIAALWLSERPEARGA